MSAEDKEYIETKSLGKIRVVHVDMSQRMRQNSKPGQQVESNLGKSHPLPEEGDDDIYALLQKIQDKRDSIFMEHEVEQGSVIKRVSNFEDDEDKIPAFKRRYVQEEPPIEMEQVKQFDWEEEAYWEPPEQEEIIQKQEIPIQPFDQDIPLANEVRQTYASSNLTHRDEIENNKVDYMRASLHADMYESEEKKEYIDDLQTEDEEVVIEKPVKEKTAESSKLIFYTILIVIVDILLILLLHSKGSLFGTSNVDDMTRYLCICIKYAVVVHLFVTLYSIYKDKKALGRGVR